MRTFSIAHIILLLLMLLVYQCSHAQDYLVTVKGDTLRGEVRPMTMGADPRVQIAPAGQKKQSFSVVQVREYTYKNAVFQPVNGVSGYTFMKVLKRGYLTLYAYQPPNQSSYDGRYLQKKDGTGIDVPNLTFKKSMKNFTSECANVSARIESGELGKRDIETIVDEFNNCINNNTSQAAEQAKKLSPFESLEAKVKNKPAFDGQKDALDMISEIRNKVERKEKVPNFMIEGLKNSLSSQADLAEDVAKALADINK